MKKKMREEANMSIWTFGDLKIEENFFKVGEIRPDWPVAGLKLTARAFDSVFTGPIGAKKIQYEYI